MGGKSIEKNQIGKSGEEAAMKAGVIAPERGVRINREDGGEDLREKEES